MEARLARWSCSPRPSWDTPKLFGRVFLPALRKVGLESRLSFHKTLRCQEEDLGKPTVLPTLNADESSIVNGKRVVRKPKRHPGNPRIPNPKEVDPERPTVLPIPYASDNLIANGKQVAKRKPSPNEEDPERQKVLSLPNADESLIENGNKQ